MATFTKPENLNGAELREELKAAGVTISEDFGAVALDENELLVLAIADKDVSKAEIVVAAHNGTIVPPELTVAQKLASVGLSLDDLKAALGV